MFSANMCDEAVKSLPESFDPGVYYGWSKLSDGPTVYKMVMSIGWNPFYKNKKKSMVSLLVPRKWMVCNMNKKCYGHFFFFFLQNNT